MSRLLIVSLILGISAPVNAGVYYYPSYQDGIEVRCKDGKPSRIVEIANSGRGMNLEGHGDDQYSWPITYLFPEAPDEKYKYFPSTSGAQCSYRKLEEKEKKLLILKAFKTCFGNEAPLDKNIERIKKYCFGWN